VVPGLVGALVAAAGVGPLAPDWLRHRSALPDWAMRDYRSEAPANNRAGHCFLAHNDTTHRFAPDCAGDQPPAPPRLRPLLLLWGDSHAAHLYQGLLAQQRRLDGAFDLAQYTRGGCAPLPGVALDWQPGCASTQAAITAAMRQLRPEVVILAAEWRIYLGARGVAQGAALARTIAELTAMGVGRVIVLGPVPMWEPSLPQLLLQALAAQGGETPRHLPRPADARTEETEALVRQATMAAGGHYVSALRTMCGDPEGCLASIVTTRGTEPIAWDYAHLTAAGSGALVGRIWERDIAPNLPLGAFHAAAGTAD
jgi:hypothetical protein